MRVTENGVGNMKNIKTYEEVNSNPPVGYRDAITYDYDDYVISIPSGQVIDMKHSELMILRDIDYVRFDHTKIYWYICKDELVPRIYQFLHREKNKFDDRSRIEEFLMDCGLLRDQFRIFDNMSVDIYTALNISYKRLYNIPFKINRCTSDFNCSFNRLLTLENCPNTIHGNFNCSYNNLKNLVGGPQHVSKSYNCSNNKLENLKGGPIDAEIFYCNDNNLITLKDAPKIKNIIYFNNPIKKEL